MKLLFTTLAIAFTYLGWAQTELRVGSYPGNAFDLSAWNPLTRKTERIQPVQQTTVKLNPGLYQLKRNKEVYWLATNGTEYIEFIPGDGISGSPETNELIRYEKYRKAIFNQTVTPVRDKLKSAIRDGNAEQAENLTGEEAKQYGVYIDSISHYGFRHLANHIALKYAALRWKGDAYLAAIAQALETYQSVYGNSPDFHEMTALFQRLKQTSIGNKAPTLEMPDGSTYGFANNTLTLVEFWASWCRPCRAANPHLVDIYADYHEQGFEIIGVSLDSRQSAMERAAETDHITWPVFTREKAYRSPNAIAYNVNALPMNYLIDQTGEVVAVNLEWEALQRYLHRALNRE